MILKNMMIVLFMLIDERWPVRDHRKNVLNAVFQEVGVSHGKQSKFIHITIVDLAKD